MLHNRISIRSVSLFVLLLFGLLLFTSATSNHTAHAAPAAPVVDTLNDEDDGVCAVGDCSLREAIAAAAPGDTITFSVNGTIVLSSGLGELVIGKNLTIDGGDIITVSGNNAVRVFKVTAGDVTFENLAITEGFFTGITIQCGLFTDKGGGGILNDGGNVTVKHSVLAYNRADCGGAILNDGDLTVTQSFLIDNLAEFGSGGAIDNRSSGTATITESELYYNTAIQNGGAINNNGTVNVTRSTISDNYATTWGGGVYSQGIVNVTNSTFSNNLASEGGGLHSYCSGDAAVNNSTFSKNRVTIAGGGIVSTGDGCTSATTTVANSIVSGNVISGTTTSDDLALQSGTTSTFSSGGYNLIGTMGSGITFAGTGEQTNVTDPKLDPLTDNGGGTWTHALQSDSPAIDNGECSSGPATDQRGVARPQDDTCDVGAYEKEQPPVAAFSGTPTSGTKPLTVSFSNESTGDISTDAWDFGDGNSSTDINPSHTYNTAGVYTVTLTVSGLGGDDTETKTSYINVADSAQPPMAAFSGTPTSGTAPLEVTFTNLSTGDITEYVWMFGDGSASNEINPSHTYATAGSYTVSLSVNGPGGDNIETKSDYITVTDSAQPPTADFSGTPTSGTKPLAVSFSSASTGDISTYAWDFGDGNSSTDPNPSHTYNTAGDYTVALTVSGPGGDDTETKTNYISVADPSQPPAAEFSGTPTSGAAPLAVNFSDASTGDISSRAWNFGDGGSSTETNPSHTYATAADYTVTLTVSGPGGEDTETKTDYISVADSAQPPEADFSGTPRAGSKPLEVSFSDQSTGEISSYDWDFGDGGSSTQASPKHTYSKAGVYTVALTVSGPGGEDTKTQTGYITIETTITGIEVNQGLGVQLNNTHKYVAGKPTVIRVLLDGRTIIDPALTSLTIYRDGRPVASLEPKPDNRPVNAVDFNCKSLAECEDWAAGSYRFEAVVNGATWDTDQQDRTILFGGRGSIRILAVPVTAKINGEIVPMDTDEWRTAGRFLRQVAPVAYDSFDWIPGPPLTYTGCDLEGDLTKPMPCNKGLWDQLKARACPANSFCTYDFVLGFVKQNPTGLPGISYGKPASVVFANLADYQASVAHVIGHAYGLGDTFDKSHAFRCDVNPAPDAYTGYRAEFDPSGPTYNYFLDKKCDKGRLVSPSNNGTLVPAGHHPYQVGGRGLLGNTGDYMGSTAKPDEVWTTQDSYDKMFDALALPLTAAGLAAPERVEWVSGSIDREFQITLDPWRDFESTTPPPDTTGDFLIEALDAEGKPVASQSLGEVQFIREFGREYAEVDEISFSTVIRFPEETVKFVISYLGKVLKEIEVSANAPVVTNVTPLSNVSIEVPYTVTWEATDADGDALTFTVGLTDPEGDGYPWTSDITEKAQQIEFCDGYACIPGGFPNQFTVTASDGVLSGEGKSAQFTTPLKTPRVTILEPELGTRYALGKEVHLLADFWYSPWIEMDQIEWSSDIDGDFGLGPQFTTKRLTEGVHTITVKVRDIMGLTATDSIKISVGRSDYVNVPAPASSDIEVSVTSEGGGGTGGETVTTTVSVPQSTADTNDIYVEVINFSTPTGSGSGSGSTPPGGGTFIRPAFEILIEVYDPETGTYIPVTEIEAGMPVTIEYGDLPPGVSAEDLKIYRWDEESGEWVDAALDCTPPSVYDYSVPGEIGLEICRTGEFAIFADPSTDATDSIFLPIIQR